MGIWAASAVSWHRSRRARGTGDRPSSPWRRRGRRAADLRRPAPHGTAKWRRRQAHRPRPRVGAVGSDASSTIMRLAGGLGNARDLIVLTNGPDTLADDGELDERRPASRVAAVSGSRAVHDRLVRPARLVAQARARRAARSARSRRARPGGRGSTAWSSRTRSTTVPLGSARLAERPDRLRAVRRGDRHPDARPGAVRVALVVERDDDLDELPGRHRRRVGRGERRDRLERRARPLEHVVRVGRELALARADPAVLDERLVPVGTHLADRRLQVDVGGRRLAPRG